MKKPYIPLYCQYKANYREDIRQAIEECMGKCHRYNLLSPLQREEREALLREIAGQVGKEVIVTSPFWCDYGYNLSFGDHFYSNHNLVIGDGAPVTFGSHVFVGPNCSFATAEHSIHPDLRREGYEIAMPIVVEDNVWIGTGVSVLAGVRIGKNSVIGAGSVVTRDIPPNVVAYGIPCRAMRPITEKDRETYPIFEE